MKRTILYEQHKKMGARFTDFGEYEMPLSFSGIKDEHIQTRKKAGIFDVSHMGEILVEGNDTYDFLNFLFTNRFDPHKTQKAIYTLMLDKLGFPLDDLIVYPLEPDRALLVVNASNKDKDYKHIKEVAKKFDVSITDTSDITCQLAIQGPKAEIIISELFDMDFDKLKFFEYVRFQYEYEGIIVSRTGYTGEDGFEIYMPNEIGLHIYKKAILFGESYGMVPVGLGARDTLRTEAALPLYGHEINENIDPVEAGLKFAVKFDKSDFIGKEALLQRRELSERKLYGVKMIGKGIPRAGYRVFYDGKDAGFITSGGYLPSLDANFAMCILETSDITMDDKVEIEIRGKKVLGKIVHLPFYNKKYKK